MTSHLKQILILISLFTLPIFAVQAGEQAEDSAPPSPEQVDTFVESGMKQLNIPGSAVALIEDGEIKHLQGFGRIDKSGTAVTPQTPFQIASVTKSFTSLIVLQLEDEGKISIDDPIVQHIPYFRTSNPKLSGKITIRHLMNHRSGLTTLDGNRYQRSQYRGEDATELAVRELTKADLENEPGEEYQYSNANYATLAHLIETIEQASYEEILESRIFSKLGMMNTFVQVANKTVAQEAKGHIQWFGLPVEDHFVAGRMMIGAGSVTSSAEDLAKYLIAVAENDPRIIPISLTNSWAKERKRTYEFGWEHDTFDGHSVRFHDGANPGFRSILMYRPGTRTGGLFLMNMSGTLDGNLHYGTMQYALGLSPADISPSKIFEYMLWGSIASLLFLAVACFFSISRLRKNVSNPWHSSVLVKWAVIAVPSLCLVTFAFTLLFYVPRSFGVDFSAASLFFPDLGVLLFAQAAIAAVWASARTILLIRRFNS